MYYYLCLGSNLGDRETNLANCIIELKKIKAELVIASSLYETEPVGNYNQPWFVNQAVKLKIDLKPFVLLNKTKIIERQMGRREAESDKSPRIIDIDILLADNMVINTENLIIPHPRMHLRNFVLTPLKEIASEALHPILQKSIKEISKICRDESQVKILRHNQNFIS